MRTILKIPIPSIALIELCWPLTPYEWQKIEEILKAYRQLSEDSSTVNNEYDKKILS